MFVAINQMRYSEKKRKKAEEQAAKAAAAAEDEEMAGKENNIIMPTGITELLNGDEEQALQHKEHLANAPLLLCCGMALPPPKTATAASIEPASNELTTTKGSVYTTTRNTITMVNEPTDMEQITYKCKNFQCNLQSDQNSKDNNRKYHHALQHCAHQNYPNSKCLWHPPTQVKTSLTTVYLCLGILTLALSTLSVLFYSHATSSSTSFSSAKSVTCQNITSSSIYANTAIPTIAAGGELNENVPEDISSFTSSPSLFRERFQQELLASEHMLYSMMQRILQQQTTDSRVKQEQQHQHHLQQPGQQQYQNDETKHMSAGTMDDHKRQSLSTIHSSPTDFDDDSFAVSDKREDETTATSTTLAELNVKNVVSDVAVTNNDGNFVGAHAVRRRDTRMLRKHNGHRDNSMAKPSETIDELFKYPKRMRRDISSSPSTSMHDPFIEFFAPSHRKVLEEQDKEIRKRTGLKGAAPGGDEWVYLNTYCRVPEKIITGFCQSTQEYCPASPQGPEGPPGPKGPNGPPGLPGIPGPKGNRGDVGLPGPPGVDGSAGPIGPRGQKGDIGIPGRPGLDGRDGVPGEPGLDGVPGRAGADGIPGKDGIPGRDGKDGMNGKDGRNGDPGPKGSQGPQGERGLKGIAGPRGRVGKPGTDGTPGIPGVNAYKVQLKNGTFLNELLIPPSIADVGRPHIRRTVIVHELKTLNLSCAATGNPPPHIEWRREDGRTININGVEMSSVTGNSLMIKHINRHHMTAYTCYADNGLEPIANATYLVEVHFQPLVRSLQTIIYAQYGRSATFECEVEAFPEAIRYWERASDGKILEPGDKYLIESYADGYKTRMILTVNHLRKDDFGYYYCVARNELNVTNLGFEIFPQDPNSVMPILTKSERVEGRMPSEPECPVCEECPDTNLYQCKDSINYNFVTQVTANGSYGGLPKRKKNCVLYAVGKPVFHRQHTNKLHVAWLRDPLAKLLDQEKTFVTTEDSNSILYEYISRRAYRQDGKPNQHLLQREFHGNAHVVYNGSLFYHIRYTSYVGKYDLTTKEYKNVSLPGAFGTGNKLYSTDYNYMDFNVDEVGLWIIYSTNDSNNTLVAKMDALNLTVEYSLNITLNHRKFGEMFIVCGHLYAIDSCTDKNSQIRYAVDLYTSKLLHVNLPFTNPFTRTTTVGYNPHTVELYSFDKGNALTYPIRYNDLNSDA